MGIYILRTSLCPYKEQLLLVQCIHFSCLIITVIVEQTLFKNIIYTVVILAEQSFVPKKPTTTLFLHTKN